MTPSKKTLEAAFPGKGAELRELLTGERMTRSYSDVVAWEKECYHAARYQERLECAVNQVMEGYGTEAIFADGSTGPDCCYINMGDTYTATLLYDYTRGRWLVTSWGDWVESQERKGTKYR